MQFIITHITFGGDLNTHSTTNFTVMNPGNLNIYMGPKMLQLHDSAMKKSQNILVLS